VKLPEFATRLAARQAWPVRDVAARVDLLLASGPRYALNHLRDERRVHSVEAATNDAVYAAIWSDAASELDASMAKLPAGILEIRRGDAHTRVWRQWVELDGMVTVRAALDRALVHEVLSREGLPVPEHIVADVDRANVAREFLNEYGPVVVKPAAGTGGGRGATSGVRTEHQLRRAALLASRHDRHLVIERQAVGDVYRFLFLDGELLDVVRRDPPHLMGDGKNTIRSLLRTENRLRLSAHGDAGLALITANLDMVFTLEHASLSLRSVPAAGERVPVKTVTNQSGPSDNHTVREPISDALIDDARRASTALGVRLAGVDLITPSLASGLAEAGGVLIEVNAGPGLHHHYHVSDRAGATRVCVPILRKLLTVKT
jgi:D-alanine-D-alanine ligase-like ATP-grasp enzyme